MSELRSGVIIQMNTEENYGTILDENFQDIDFALTNLPEGIKVNARVSFTIQLMAEGLMAIHLCLL